MKKLKFKLSQSQDDTLSCIMTIILLAIMIIANILYND